MRLSFGQELRMVQKQVLAPRMIQSMEILQLPIMALQERIEQEMQENPAARTAGRRPRPARGTGRDRQSRRPLGRRARAGRRREQEQRGGFRAPAEHGRGVARPLRGALQAVQHADGGRRPARPRRDGQHGRPAAIAARLSARSIGLVRHRPRTAADVRPHHLQPRRQRLSARPARRPDRARRSARAIGPGQRGARPWCSGSIRPAWPPAICASACCCSSSRAFPITNSSRR